MRLSQKLWFMFLATTIAVLLQSCRSPGAPTSNLEAINLALQGVDLTASGPLAFDTAEYKLEPGMIRALKNKFISQVRGQLYVPKGSGRYPLLVFMHGNTETCVRLSEDKRKILRFGSEFSYRGACLDGMEEFKSNLGFDYLAKHLASHGYIVASINTNRGINGVAGPREDPENIRTRALLVLEHLKTLNEWDKKGAEGQAVPLQLRAKIDFAQVGLMGHSRGGEAMRLATAMINEGDLRIEIPELSVRGLLELSPSSLEENQSRISETNWALVLATCDADTTQHESTEIFARRRRSSGGAFSSVFAIPGASHNGFNSKWLISAWHCLSREARLDAQMQRQISLMVGTAFFRGFVGSQRTELWQRIFDPQYALPTQFDKIANPVRESLDAGGKVGGLKIGPFAGFSPVSTEEGDRLLWHFAASDDAQESAYVSVKLDPADSDLVTGSRDEVISLFVAPEVDETESNVPFDFELRAQNESGAVGRGLRFSKHVSATYLNSGAPTFKMKKRNPLFYEFPLQWSDLGVASPSEVTGFKLEFPRGYKGSFLLDQVFSVRPEAIGSQLKR